jgi:methionyl aminopeptidase
LIDVAWQALDRGVEKARPGNRVSDISNAIGTFVESQGYTVVKTFVGHGIGRAMHEDPQVPNYGPAGKGTRLRPGMVLAIEPMVKEDPEEVEVADDGWTARTPNGGLAAHVEEMVLITERGPERLSRSTR